MRKISPDTPIARLARQFADGQWHSTIEMQEAMGMNPKQLQTALSHGRRQVFTLERRGKPHALEYRLFPKSTLVSLMEIRFALLPIIEDFDRAGKKPAGTAHPREFQRAAAQLRKVLTEWGERPTDDEASVAADLDTPDAEEVVS